MKKQLYKKVISLLGVTALSAALVTGCSQTSTDKEAAASGTSGNNEEAVVQSAELDTSENNTILVSTTPGNIRVAINILAKQLGYYEEEGVNVEFVDISDAASALSALSTDKDDLDVHGTGIVPDLTFITNGSDLVIFEGTAVEGGAIIALPENVETFKDLKNFENTTVAMVRNQTSWVVTRDLMLQQGIDVSSITIKEVDSQVNVAQAVAKGEADTGFLPVEYANSFRSEGVEIVREVGEICPNYVCCRQITSRNKSEEKRDAFVKYTKANLRAWNYFEDEANRQDVIKVLADFSGQTEDYVNEYFFVNHTILTLDPNKKGIEEFYQAMISSNYFEDSTPVNISDYIDTSIYKDALDAVIAEYPDDSFYQQALKDFEAYN